MYLLVSETEDESRKDITKEKIQSLNEQNIYLVVRESIKRRFLDKANVLGFNQFFCEELARLSQGWGNIQTP